MSAQDFSQLPYRLNVGAVLFNKEGLVWVGKRADLRPGAHGGLSHAWQLPQGGIDDGEDPGSAVLRELAEEVGTANAAVLAEHPEWLSYDLPPELLGVAWGGRYRGQKQRWFALRFLGADDEINLAADDHPEFCDWAWVELARLPELAVPFKRAIYARLAEDFAGFAEAR